jgi:hypothetical protein
MHDPLIHEWSDSFMNGTHFNAWPERKISRAQVTQRENDPV